MKRVRFLQKAVIVYSREEANLITTTIINAVNWPIFD